MSILDFEVVIFSQNSRKKASQRKFFNWFFPNFCINVCSARKYTFPQTILKIFQELSVFEESAFLWNFLAAANHFGEIPYKWLIKEKLVKYRSGKIPLLLLIVLHKCSELFFSSIVWCIIELSYHHYFMVNSLANSPTKSLNGLSTTTVLIMMHFCHCSRNIQKMYFEAM